MRRTRTEVTSCALILGLAAPVLSFVAEARATCNDPEKGDSRPCYADLEKHPVGSAFDPVFFRNMIDCPKGLLRGDPDNPYILLHLARAYYHTASPLQAWITYGRAWERMLSCAAVVAEEKENFKDLIDKPRAELGVVGQWTRLSFPEKNRPDKGPIEIDGIEVEERYWTSDIPLSVGEHSIHWRQGVRRCHRGIGVKHEENVTLTTLTCDMDPPPCPPPPSDVLQRRIGIGLVGAGVVGAAALGIGFGWAAHSKRKDSDAKCGSAGGFLDPDTCTPEGLALDRAAQTYRTAAYWSVGFGAAAAVAGTALLIPWRHVFGVVPLTDGQASGLCIQTSW